MITEKKLIDTQTAKQVLISSVIGKYIGLKRNGKEYDALCPFHSDQHIGNFKVNDQKGMYYCFSCQSGGDAIEFLMKYKNIDFQSAVNEINNNGFLPMKQTTKEEVTQINPVPEGVTIPNFKDAIIYPYHNPDGSLYGFIKRVEKNGKKELYPHIYTDKGWVSRGFKGVLPLYNIHELNIQSTVCIVEGEKCAEYLKPLLPADYLVVTWQGGTSSARKSDWTTIKDREIIFLPDNDGVGYKVMHEIRSILGCECKYIAPPKGSPPAWDIADSGYNSQQVAEYLKRAVTLKGNEIYQVIQDINESLIESDDDSVPFTCLGFTKTDDNKQNFIFYSKSPKVLLSYSIGGLTQNALMTLADINYWEMQHPGKTGVNMTGSVNWIVQRENAIGYFDSDNLRGRGAWIDKGRIVFHAGDKLFIDGQKRPLGKPSNSKFIYEAGVPLEVDNLLNPLSAKEAERLFEITDLINWGKPFYGSLFAGWHFIASVCGALTWRPHLVVTGESGAGKSFVSNLGKQLLGKTVQSLAGTTTEAGVRQTLGCDALPVVFEEIDTKTQKGKDRVSNIIELMRNCSQDGQDIKKGTTGGTAITYKMRSMFGLIGIGVYQEDEQDTNRATVLSIHRFPKTAGNDKFLNLQKKIKEVFTDEWLERFLARSISMIPTIIENIKVFNLAGMSEFEKQRDNDQMSAILGGYYAITSDEVVTFEEALQIIQINGLGRTVVTDKENSQDALLDYLLSHKLKHEKDNKTVERTVSELIFDAMQHFGNKCAEHDTLMRNGFRILDGGLIISNTNQYIKDALKNTEWSKNHHVFLKRIKGAAACGSTYFKGQLKNTAAVKIPLSAVGEFESIAAADEQEAPF